ncbi:MAG: hypothetical protein ACK4OP_13880, partial [Gemmobacter sp.]
DGAHAGCAADQMIDYARILREDARLRLLAALDDQPDGRLNPDTDLVWSRRSDTVWTTRADTVWTYIGDPP